MGHLLKNTGHFCPIYTSPSLLHVLSSTSVAVTYKRGKNHSGFSHVCFSYQAGKPQKEEDQVSAGFVNTGLPAFALVSKARNHQQEQLPNSLPPAPTQQRTRRISVPLPNGPSLLCRTQLSLQSLCTPDIEVFRSLCSFFTSQGKEHVLRPLSRQLRSLNMLSIMWLDNGQGNMGNH